MNPSVLDGLILISAIPGILLVFALCLPLEHSIALKELPKGPLGLYIVYLSFVCWQFKLPRWSSIVALAVGFAFCVSALWQKHVNSKT